MEIVDKNGLILDSEVIQRRVDGINAVQHSIRVTPDIVNRDKDGILINNAFENVQINVIKTEAGIESVVD
jgi:hypothetical protein